MKRRDFTKTMAGALAGLALPGGRVGAEPAAVGLSDPAVQPMFVNLVPDALAPGNKFDLRLNRGRAASVKAAIGPAVQQTGLVDALGAPLNTPVFGYGSPQGGFSWPGPTFEVNSGEPVRVRWENRLWNPFIDSPTGHLLPVDTTLHWAYSLPGYRRYSIARDGIPVVAHLHGGHTESASDGGPEFFFSPGWAVRGPRWVKKDYVYDNDQRAGNLFYHDHALGITRLNNFAGLTGFYLIRDDLDTGLPGNPLGLPAWPYEKAYMIQDRMFRANGELFFPAFPGDPFYDGFINGEGAILPPEVFPGGGPTALAEFFGDHMVVNGKIWPRENVEPRSYRLRLLNYNDSRFMVLRLRVASSNTATDLSGASEPIPFHVIGSDQGLASSASEVTALVVEPSGRYDIVVDFSQVPAGSRVIMENLGGDEPFGGDVPGPRIFGETNRVMAFDVVLPLDTAVPDTFDPSVVGPFSGVSGEVSRTRKLALFEGTDEYGRLQPMQGPAEPATDHQGNPVDWPADGAHAAVGLVGQISGAMAWHHPVTENPRLGDTEIWEIHNATEDAHPIHVHLVHFEVLDRKPFTAELVPQPVVQHNGAVGNGFRLENIAVDSTPVDPGSAYVENAPKDMVTALPGQVTRIKMTFDRPGRYVWHCHILSHEDHEMMRPFHVGPGA